jgi:integrase
MHRGELLGLRWVDIDFERDELSVVRTREQTSDGLNFKEPKTDNARRRITLPPMSIEALRNHRVRQAEQRLFLGPAFEDHGLVLAREDGAPWSPNKLSAAFGKLVRSQNIPQARFHDLRHSHATQLLKQGIHPKIVSERLGHSSIAITLDLYSHVLPGMQRDAALGFDRALQQAIDEENENESGT